jgi:hypothetical protein
MIAIPRDYARKPGRYYGCGYYRTRGTSVCKNSLVLEQDLMDAVVLSAIKEALEERMLEVAVEKALIRLRAGHETRLDRRRTIDRELSLIEAQEKYLVDAIARGEAPDPLLARLRAEEVRKKVLIQQLNDLTRGASVVELDAARMKRELRRNVMDAVGLLQQNVAQARQILRKLLEKPLLCEAIKEGKRCGYRITGQGNYVPLLTSNSCSNGGGVPNGEHVF